MVRRLLYLNGLAVLGAVIYHASAWGYIGLFWWTDRYRSVSVPNFDAFGGLNYFGLRVMEQLIIFAIPAFLFVSGYFNAFAAGRTRDTIGYGVVWARVKNLLTPFVLWSLILLLLDLVMGERGGLSGLVDSLRTDPITTLLNYGRIIITGQATQAYYFVPVLIQLYLLGPLMLPAAKKRPVLLLLVTALIQSIVVALRYNLILGLDLSLPAWVVLLTRSWFFPGYLFWFAFGAVFGFHQARIKPALIAIRLYLLIGLGITFIAGMVEWEALLRLSGEQWVGPRETLVDNVYSILFLLTFIAYETAPLPLMNRIGYLGSRSFGIYLVHTLALIYTARIVANLLPQILNVQLIFQPLLYLAAIGIPLVMMWMLDKSPARRIYSYIFG